MANHREWYIPPLVERIVILRTDLIEKGKGLMSLITFFWFPFFRLFTFPDELNINVITLLRTMSCLASSLVIFKEEEHLFNLSFCRFFSLNKHVWDHLVLTRFSTTTKGMYYLRITRVDFTSINLRISWRNDKLLFWNVTALSIN